MNTMSFLLIMIAQLVIAVVVRVRWAMIAVFIVTLIAPPIYWGHAQGGWWFVWRGVSAQRPST
jgi:hypothetical protein